MSPVPERLWLVESFLNSLDTESGKDDLTSPDSFTRWLGEHRRPALATDADLVTARQLRAGLRELVRGHHDGADPAHTVLEALDALAADLPLRARFQPSGVVVETAGAGVPGVLGEVLASVVLAESDGTWRRLKICKEDTCQYVFYDRSKNSSGNWCSMNPCGNRNKARAYRSRMRRAAGA